ncbi:response regulator receiver protein [Candidatus Liberibacter solanacearum CLso-ZC1]|uniref:Response regulator receiver protein n=1 Tax=Liberibacter solanacearum (strain CLso-ZC1) TaxID=658172 RepID=E4UC00_LIBSC|nr:transcriptional regulator [Candidatus Liberibacter solanacearum]ADR51890.1 response regulator receiver protein [Candidatus Liberibacter solanacearum CLso-ZC1]
MSIEYKGSGSDVLNKHGDGSLPSISAHAFCVTDSLYSVIEKSKIDRRMNRVNMRITKGSITEAIDVFADSATPNLLIIQTTVDSRKILSSLEPLAEVCDSTTKVIVIGETNDVLLYRELIASGISEYLIEPLSVSDIIKAISNIFVEKNKEDSFGSSIAFIGSRGGVGSSTIAHNCAFSIASVLATDTILADLDLPYGTANINFDQDPIYGILDLISSSGKIDEGLVDKIMVRYVENLSILTAPAILDCTYDFDEKDILPVIELLKRIAPLTILDLPHIWNRWNRQILTLSDKVVITTSLDLVSLRNTKNLIDFLTKNRPNDKPPYLVINQVGMPKKPEISIDDFCAPLGIDPSVIIPFDAFVFGISANSGKMIREMNPQSSVSNLLVDFSNILLDRITIVKPKNAIYDKIKTFLKIK